MGFDGRGTRGKRGEADDAGNTRRPGSSYKPGGQESGDRQSSGQVEYGRLKTGVAVATSGFVRLGLMVVEQPSQQPNDQDRDNGTCNRCVTARAAPFHVECPEADQERSLIEARVEDQWESCERAENPKQRAC